MTSSVLIDDYSDLIKRVDFSRLNNKTILVTGATGYIGSWVCKFLAYSKEQGYFNGSVLAGYRNVNKINENYPKKFRKHIDFVELDVSNRIDICNYNIDIVMHLASPTTSKELVNVPVDSIRSIVNGTQNILDFSVNNNVEKLIYLSSMEVYNGYKELTKVSEEQVGVINPLIVRNCYPQGKLLAESLCAAYHSQYGIDISVIRLAQTFGSGILKSENRVFAQFIKNAIQNKDLKIKTDGMSISNFCDISDCAYALLWFASRQKGLEVFNVCNENSTSTIKELAYRIKETVANDSIEVIIEGETPNLINGYPASAKYVLDTTKAKAAGLKLNTSLNTSINNAKKSIIENEYE
ncbi:NAD-dependent epimerase/dehydratase family protein [Vibrio sp. SCSIO 43133]|uniref:NAD-dependent epimerase/dehydratase family protein n=1 Tax=Vibrio sp. SCSIO 43133 TaxID=2802577 RepID=UPI00207653FE|nr:NAD-dependent epimerase/dehydratase family protein [Vibrio sp. SCSIO 43133]USE00338.1 NAD-dependent epimerase/dehydratase family protein [Vibrio sp. SCSIO 43133]